MNRTVLTILCILALCPAYVGQSVFGRAIAGRTLQDTTAGRLELTPVAIFRAIEKGISTGDVSLFSAHFGNTLRLDIRGSQAGYYSANQAGQILRHFLGKRSAPKFRFSREDTGKNPYATGGSVFSSGRRNERIQIYIGLARDGTRWVISQFSIY